MGDNNFRESIIKKWEEKTGCKHSATVEINEGQWLPYYDHRFVKDLIDYCEILYNRQQDAKGSLNDILTLLDKE